MIGKQKGILIRDVTRKECPWLSTDLKAGRKVYRYGLYNYGIVSDKGVAVTDEP